MKKKKTLPYLYVCLAAAFCCDPAVEKPALLPRHSRNGSIVGKITRRTSRVADVAASPEFSRWLPFIERTLLVDDVSGFGTNQEVDALVEGPGSLEEGKATWLDAASLWDISDLLLHDVDHTLVLTPTLTC